MNLTLEQELAQRQRGVTSQPQQAVTAPTSALESHIGAASDALTRIVPPAGRPTQPPPAQPPASATEEEIAAAYLALSRSGQQPRTPEERDRLARALAFRNRLRETTAGAEPTAPVRQEALAGRGGLATAVTEIGRIPERLTRPLVTPEQVQALPAFLRPLGRAARELTSPTQLGLLAATAGIGPAAGTAGRLVGQAAIGTGSILAGQEVASHIPETAPLAARLGLPLAAGLATGGGAIAAGRAVGPALGAVRSGAAEALVRMPSRGAQAAGVQLASRGRGALPQGAAAAVPAGADVPPYVAPSPVAGNVIGLRPIQSGLSSADELANIAKRTVSKVGIQTVEANPLVSGAFRERARAKSVVASQSQRLGTVYGEVITRVFQPDKDGRIAALAGIDSKVPGAPTIQDVAARLPNYWAALSEEQRSALLALRQDVNPYRALLSEVGVEVPARPDVMEGGFYLPRGRADIEGADLPLKVFAGGGGRGAKKGFERPAVFESQAAGIEAKYKYAPIGDTLTAYSRDAGNRAVDAHLTNFFKTAKDETGEPLASTPKSRLLEQNPEVAAQMDELRTGVTRLRGLAARLTDKQDEVLTRFLDDPTFDDIDSLRETLAKVVVRRGRSKGADVGEVRDELAAVKERLKDMAPAYKTALRRAMATPRLEGVIGLPGLQGVTFPDEIANAANTALKTEGRSTGPAAAAMDVVNAFNNLYRGMRATLDNSALGIQGLLGAADNPVAYGKAVGVNIRAWGPGGEKALGRFIVQFDAAARAAGRLSSDDWARAGLRIGGAQTEFQLGQGISAAVGRLPLVRGANRAFGYFGDALRLFWADDMLRTAPDGRASAERIARIANNMTGWAEGKTFGSMGDLLLFAPRFLQARLETTVQGVAGLRPGASIEQAAARRSLLKMVGYATVLTVAANEMLGNETDFRPLAKGKWNPNFLRIRYAGRDWTILGTWDSLARAVTLTAGGHPEGALRGLGSGVLTSAWDLISGRTFAGKPVRDNVQDFALWIMGQFVPFSTEEVPATIQAGAEAVAQGEAGKAVGSALTTAGMLVGGKSSPLSHQERMVERVVKQYGPAAQTVVDGLDRLGVTMARVNTKFDMRPGVKGGEIDLTSAQRDSLQELTEDTVIRGLRDTFTSRGFQRWTPERQKEYLESLVTALREQARSKFRASLHRTAPPAQGAPPDQNLLLERLSRGIGTP